MIQERPAKPAWNLFDDPWGPPTGWEIGPHSIKITGIVKDQTKEKKNGKIT
jgi:hypothetical protein